MVDFPLVNSREALLWMVQMNCIDMNAWYSRVDKPDAARTTSSSTSIRPTASSRSAVRAAHARAGGARRLELRSYVKTSGADGIHVLVPIARRYGFDRDARVRGGASRSGWRRRTPASITTEWLKRKRVGVLARLPPERRRQDDRVGLLRPPEAGRAGLDPARVGRADAEARPGQLHDGVGAGAGRGAAATSSSRRCRVSRACRRSSARTHRERRSSRHEPEAATRQRR